MRQGGLGSALSGTLVANGHLPIALYREGKQAANLQGLGALSVEGDPLEPDQDTLAAHMASCDVVAFTVGAGGRVLMRQVRLMGVACNNRQTLLRRLV